jgi:hypothetical protein
LTIFEEDELELEDIGGVEVVEIDKLSSYISHK